ncbi:FHA domain-containing protein [Amycolatopsis sp. K13G38]|uniref:FHA domain-containing protein n=1 Tax=Amycolatopsis acididurans TaxID=2724524 RepID=A0ABX1IYY6_9PSEU|nr:FHA domain-containing protein [Amycolatopsis acididurans]NKQ52738.1 FHA domain-containing protein [Amycolatopsis acididurans]
MPVCVNGHDSADDEYCDVCGLAFAAPEAPAAPVPEPAPEPAPAAHPCPACGAPVEGRFCESCGHDSLAAPPEPAPQSAAGDRKEATGTFAVLVTADRAYYDTVRAEGGSGADPVEFPPFCPERRFPLRGKQMSIGRRSVSRGILPDIDLTGPPEDAGVSRMHALLVADDTGTWSIVDMDSANGTYLGNSRAPLKPNTPHPLADGDTVHLGAWTTLTLIRE